MGVFGAGLGGGGGGGGGGGAATLGGSISMMCVNISAGITCSAARRSRPFCIAHSTATWKTTTLAAITMLRLIGKRTAVVGDERASEREMAEAFIESLVDAGGRTQRAREKGKPGQRRKIHHSGPITRIRLPAKLAKRVREDSMRCLPGGDRRA